MAANAATVLVTGAAGNLGQRLLPLLGDFRVIAIDMRRPARAEGFAAFEALDMGRESSCQRLVELALEHRASAIVHLAFVIDPLRTGVLDVERQWQINVAGTARVMEAISEANRMGGIVRTLIYPSSVSAYGSDLPAHVREDFLLGAHTLPYAIHKMEADLAVQKRAATLGDCCAYLLRPHIFAGASMENYLIGALRGTPTGKGRMAQRMRERGQRLPLLIPSGARNLDTKFQFVHVDDVARLMVWLLRRPHPGSALEILNVAGRGPALSIERCAGLARAKVLRLPRWLCPLVLRLLWMAGISGIPPEAFPYMSGTYTMDIGKLRAMLGGEFTEVIRYTVDEALADSFRPPADTVREQGQPATAG